MIKPHLKRCGYDASLLAENYQFGAKQVPLAAFSDSPLDARSVSIAVIDVPSDPETAVADIRLLGSPVVFACHGRKVQWWKQTPGKPLLIEAFDRDQTETFFDQHKTDFSPARIFEGKTLRRLPGQMQLTFVDAGLMPFVERTEGERLSHLVETAFADIAEVLKHPLRGEKDTQNAIKATFWLLAAKALCDKSVDGFKTVDLRAIDDVFDRVGRHYGVPDGVPPPGKAWHEATTRAAQRISGFDSLRNLSTESLAHVYENALVTPEIRKANGTHSTPGALVDYMVWQLWPWIQALPRERRHVFEPACGHAAFLVSALRMLRQWSGIDDSRTRHEYLKKHLHGIEYDAFALEVARLSLTLADIPHGNKWDLKQADMFLGTTLEDGAQKCGILLANPPYERFTREERSAYERAGIELGANTKACDLLRRTIPHLTGDTCFGVVVPQGLLHNKEGTSLRRELLADFELCEIDVFEDKLFEKSEHEVAVLIGRRKSKKGASPTFWFRRVRNTGLDAFRDRFAFSSEQMANIEQFTADESANLWIPELGALWVYFSAYPTLGDVATVGQGLFHKGESLPPGSWTIHTPPQPGDVLGFANPDGVAIFDLPTTVGINITPSVVDRTVAGLPTHKPQVLLNYGRGSRDAWRLRAVLDEQGRAVTSRFAAIRPKEPGISALYLWAVLNSPVANAFAHCHTFKRDILVGMIRKIPIPHHSPAHVSHIEQAALRYRALALSSGPLFDTNATPEGICKALLEMDAAVLRAYDLPPRLERQLLDFFTDVDRKGAGCTFTAYYPPGFTSFLPLHLILSERFQRAAADVTSDRFRPGESDYVRSVLAAATGDEE